MRTTVFSGLVNSPLHVVKKLLLQHRYVLITTLLIACITGFCPPAIGEGFSQNTVTLSEVNTPMEKVLEKIKNQTGYLLWYTAELLRQAKPVNITLKDAPLEQALKQVFAEQPLLGYRIVDKVIVLKPTEKAGKEVAGDPPITVRGRVLNEQGEPVAGVTVTVKGTDNVTATDGNGGFVLNNIDGNSVLKLTAVNIVPNETSINNRILLLVTVKGKTGVLDEVQVEAYRTTNRRIGTGNISTIKAVDISKQPVNNPLLALQGRVPGLLITQSTGLPGSGVTVRIQGQNSIRSGNDPLYVIDGVPYYSQVLPTLVSVLGTSGINLNDAANTSYGNPMSYINPADIESIDVLKDADATAIYGSRAANGAILITTKKGKAGATKFDLNMQQGWGEVTQKMDLLNTQQYLDMRREAKKNDNANVLGTDYDLNGTWDQNRYTDWQKELIGGTSKYTDVQTTISGGTSTTQFLAGVGYHRETTVFPGDFSDKKGSLHFNINNVSPNQKFRFQLSGNYLIDNNRLVANDLTGVAIKLPPNAPALYNADGSFNWARIPSGTDSLSTWQNPLIYLKRRYNNKTTNLVGNALVSYELLPGLDIKSSFGYTNLQTKEISTSPLDAFAPEIRASNQRVASYGNGNANSWIIEPQATYKHRLAKGMLEVLIGGTLQQNNTEQQQFQGRGYNTDLILDDIKSASTVTVTSTILSRYNYNAAFGRINYNWQDKYIVNLTGRRDGSSRFGSENLFHNFGSVGTAWIFSKEGFVKKHLSFLSFGKLRASYGTTGSDQIGDYQFMSLYKGPLSVPQVPFQGVTGLQPNGIANPYLQWEETRKLQAGIDIGLFSDRILVNVNYYHNRSSNQLLAYNLPVITGVNSINTNFPALIQNTGWELSLNTTNVKTKNITWTSNINLTVSRNKLVDFPNLATSSYASSLVIGKPITILKLYNFGGVNPATGAFQFMKENGTLTSSPNSLTDRTVILDPTPEYFGGFQNSISYKGIQLDFLFQFVKQLAGTYRLGSRPGFFGSGNNTIPVGNQPVYVLDRWQKAGDVTNTQRYSSTSSLLLQSILYAPLSSTVWEDASYIRLKNVSVSWQIPYSWSRKMHLQNLRVYAQGQNLFTITSYKGLDPETRSSTSLPPLRIITMGMQVTL